MPPNDPPQTAGPDIDALMKAAQAQQAQAERQGKGIPNVFGGPVMPNTGEAGGGAWNMNPEARNAALIAAGTDLSGGMLAPLLGRGLAKVLPGLLRGLKDMPMPSVVEAGSSALKAGTGAAADTLIKQTGRETPDIKPYTDIAGDVVGAALPMGIKAGARGLAPEVTPEKHKLARQAEWEGMRFTPQQLAGDQTKFVYSPENARVGTRIVTQAADGRPVDRITSAWFQSTEKRINQAYEYIFSPNNIFPMNTGTQDQVVNTVMEGVTKNIPGADKFFDRAQATVPFLVQPSVKPLAGGALQSNPGFLPLTGDQMREARDLIRELQRSGNAQTRRYGNDVWDALMDNIKATDPHIYQQLQVTNSRFRAYRAINEMAEDGKLKNQTVDLPYLAKWMREGRGSKKYIHGTDKSQLAQAGRIGEELGVLPQKPDTKPNKLAEYGLMGTGALLGGAAPYAFGKRDFSWQDLVTNMLLGVGAAKVAPIAAKPFKAGASHVGRFIQQVEKASPQAEDLARRGFIARNYRRFREPGAAVIGANAAEEE